ncbi:hypothetical protein CROQUDRAFT_716253 [Cronartium quercuum f. sp. fusiforme G11]|uniref:Uncharacterized protein n=1 Tax=Cronartium quercuum f. sp. fusiforme G11 TaxID=708437 RepID=A0A9P6NE54_9BASI|nr:hypothetical protein CROQUDRAFT_716253 [Cronartium quercuum f. sp. fusiforme G11]
MKPSPVSLAIPAPFRGVCRTAQTCAPSLLQIIRPLLYIGRYSIGPSTIAEFEKRFSGTCALLLVYGLIDRGVSRPVDNLVKEGLDIGNKPKIQDVGSFEKPVEAKDLDVARHNDQTEKVNSDFHKKSVSFENDGKNPDTSSPYPKPQNFDYPALAKAMEIMDKDGVSTVKTPNGLILITEADPNARAQKAMETHILHNLMTDSLVKKLEAEVLAEHPGLGDHMGASIPSLKFMLRAYQTQTMSDADATEHLLKALSVETIEAMLMNFSGLDKKELQQVLHEMGIAEGASAEDLIKAMMADDSKENSAHEKLPDVEYDVTTLLGTKSAAFHDLHGSEISEDLMKKWMEGKKKQHPVNETPDTQGDTPLPENHGHPNSPKSEVETAFKYDAVVEDDQAEDISLKFLRQFTQAWGMEKPREGVKVQDTEGIEKIINSGDHKKDVNEALGIHLVQNFFTDNLIQRIEHVWGEEYPQFKEHLALFKSTLQEARQKAAETLKSLPAVS